MPNLYGKIEKSGFDVKIDLRKKFCDDEVYFEDDKKIILLEGVILNSDNILEKNYCANLEQLISLKYEQQNEFFKEFRGNFYGCCCDKINKKAWIFNDHHGNKPLFYYIKNNEEIYFSDSVLNLIENIKKDGENIRLNMKGVYSLLTNAYMYGNNTIFDNVYRLIPGQYISYNNGKIDFIYYYKVNNKNIINVSEDEAIENIDRLFLEAVSLQMKKNEKYGFDNYAPLSAGLDSRMTTYALNRLGAENVVNFTYSQSGQTDENVPQKVAAELKNIWLFKNLDNGLDLFDIDDSLYLADSLIYYPWPSQLNGFLKLINTDKLGVVHTGVIGDVVASSFYKSEERRSYKLGDGAYSIKLLEKAREYIGELDDEDYEIGMFYNRGFNGACLGYSTSFRQYTEGMSPFMYVDFFDYCLSLPLKYRANHNIYYKWVKKCYPAACKYAHNGIKIRTANKYVKYNGKKIPINGVFARVKNIMKGKLHIEVGMNPGDLWYRQNGKLQEFMDKYYNERLYLIEDNVELLKDVKYLYEKGNAIEKTLCISLLGTVEKYI